MLNPRVTATQPTGSKYYPTLLIPVEEGTKSIRAEYVHLTNRLEGEVLHSLWGNLTGSGLYRYKIMVRAGFNTPEEALSFGVQTLHTILGSTLFTEENAEYQRDVYL